MALLVVVVVALAVAAGFVAGREHGQQMLGARVAEAVAPKTPEVCAVFVGGPCDGGRLRVTPAVRDRITVHLALGPGSCGCYRRGGWVGMPDGGAVVEFVWEPVRERAS